MDKEMDCTRLQAGGRYGLKQNNGPEQCSDQESTSECDEMSIKTLVPNNNCNNSRAKQNNCVINKPPSCQTSARYAQNPPNQNLLDLKLKSKSADTRMPKMCNVGKCEKLSPSQNKNKTERCPPNGSARKRPPTPCSKPKVCLPKPIEKLCPKPCPQIIPPISPEAGPSGCTKCPLPNEEKPVSCDPSPQISSSESECSESCGKKTEQITKTGKNICCEKKENKTTKEYLKPFIEEMNSIFVARLCDVEMKAPCADKLKIPIYSEWVDMLLTMIRTLQSSLSEMEKEATCRIAQLEKLLHEKSASQTNSISDNECELQNLKNDVSNFMELIHRANREGKWNFDGLQFKTVNQDTIIVDKCLIPKSQSAVSLPKNCPSLEDKSSNCSKTNCTEKILPEDCIISPPIVCSTPNATLATETSDCQLKNSCSTISKNASSTMSILNNCENNCIQQLKTELNQLFKCHRNIMGSMEQIKLNSQVELCEKQFEELSLTLIKNESKIKYMHKQLKNIVDDKLDSCDSDAGYKSQEDLEPEKGFINCITKRMKSLLEENADLKCKFKNLCKSVEDTTSSGNKSNILDQNREILGTVAEYLSSLCEQDVSVQALVFQDLPTGCPEQQIDKTACDRCPEITPFCDAINKLEKTLLDKECALTKMNESKFNLEQELINCQMNLQNERRNRTAEHKKLSHQMCMDLKTIEGLEHIKDGFSNALCRSEARNNELSIIVENLEESNCRLAQDNRELTNELHEMSCSLVMLQKKLEGASPQDNYRKPLTPLQIPSPSQLLLTTTTTNPTTTISSASIPLQQKLIHNSNNYHNYQSMQSPEQRRLSNEEHQEYRNIINDLTNELVDLTSQVSLVHDKFDNADTAKPFEKTLKEFEQQNDLLQKTIQALEMSNAEKDKIIADKTANQNSSRYQLSNFENSLTKSNSPTIVTLFEDVQYYTEQFKDFKIKCTCGAAKSLGSAIERSKKPVVDYEAIFSLLENKTRDLQKVQEEARIDKTALKKEIFDLDEKNKRNIIKIMDLKEILIKKDCKLDEMKSQLMKQSVLNINENIIKNLKTDLEKEKSMHEDQMLKVKSELQNLRKHLDEQETSFSKQAESITQLEKQLGNCRMQSEIAQKENKFLQDELFSLKERLACSEGTERSLKEQIHKSQEELVNTKCDLQKINAYSEEIDSYKKSHSMLKENYLKVIRKFNELIDDYNDLHENYEKNFKLNLLYQNELQYFQKWKSDQTEMDKMNEQKLEEMTDQIRMLTNDRTKLIAKCNEMYKDTYIMGSMLEKYKTGIDNALSAPTQFIGDVASISSPHQMMSMLQKTATKLHHTRMAWNEQLNERRNSE